MRVDRRRKAVSLAAQSSSVSGLEETVRTPTRKLDLRFLEAQLSAADTRFYVRNLVCVVRQNALRGVACAKRSQLVAGSAGLLIRSAHLKLDADVADEPPLFMCCLLIVITHFEVPCASVSMVPLLFSELVGLRSTLPLSSGEVR